MTVPVHEFGSLSQLGYVVTDIDRAIDHWVGDGVGPWYLFRHVEVTGFVHRGQPGSVDMTIGLAYAGGMQVELIQQHDDSPTLYREFLERSGEGLQHLGYFPADFDAALAGVTSAGWEVGQSGHIGTGRFIYFDNQHHPGTTLEISELTDSRRSFFSRLRTECEAWDGRGDPRRVR